MSQISKTLSISEKIGVVYINNSYKSSIVKFKVASLINKPFYIAISTQEQLDDGEKIDFNNVEYEIIGDFKIEQSNEEKSYIIILKSDEPNQVSIEIDIDENLEEEKNINENYEETELKEGDNENNYTNIWKYIVVSILVLIGIILCLYFYISDKKKKNENKQIIIPENNIIEKINETTTKKYKYSPSISMSSENSSLSSDKSFTFDDKYKKFSPSPRTKKASKLLFGN